MNVRDQMAQAVRFNGHRTAVVHRERRLSFDEAWDRGIRFANGLIELGLQPGDRVAVLEDNCLESVDFITGCAIANLVRVPLYARNSVEAHAYMLTHTECRALVVSARYAPEAVALRQMAPCLAQVIVRDEHYEPWLARQCGQAPNIAIAPDDWFIIRHTGGTTGRAKAVAYSHRSWLAACRDWFYIFPQVVQGDACLHCGPISHASGYQFLPVWLAGGCNVLLDHFDAGEVFDLIERERIGYFQAVATMLRAMIDHPTAQDRDFSSLKCLLVGAAPVNDRTAIEARALFGDVLYQGYGETEVLPIAFMGPAQWFAEIEGSSPLRACGMVMPFSRIDIWDEESQSVPIGEIGEIVAQSDGMMTQFWNDPQTSAERITDGWVKTGDIGRIDRNGYVYLIDRASDTIISGGYNIYPADIERVIANHPAVTEAAVFGVPHDRWGESPMALCVIRPDVAICEEELIAAITRELGAYQKPSRFEFRSDPLPRNAVGKINRKALREPYWQGAARRVAGS